MHRTSSSIKRHALSAALGMLLLVLAGCGSNPVAPIVNPSNQAGTLAVAAKALKHGNAYGRGRNSQNSSGVSSSGTSGGSNGVSSGSFGSPGEETDEPLVIE